MLDKVGHQNVGFLTMRLKYYLAVDTGEVYIPTLSGGKHV